MVPALCPSPVVATYLLRRRSETDRFALFFSIFSFFFVFSCVLALPRSARTDALFTVREPPNLRFYARRALASDEISPFRRALHSTHASAVESSRHITHVCPSSPGVRRAPHSLHDHLGG